MGVTLILISCVVATGSTVIFSGEFCQIYNADKKRVGEIKESRGLYQVYKPGNGEQVNAANPNEMLMIDKLHRHLGHVSHERAKLLVVKGLAKGLSLDRESQPTVCESCEWAKSTRKTVVKEREGGKCAAVGDEVHSDIWGPAVRGHNL